MNRSGFGGLRLHHFTETLPEVIARLEHQYKASVEVLSAGADLKVGNVYVEVKAAVEWMKANRHSHGERRRGRFHFHGTENADVVCFVLVKEDGTYAIRIIDMEHVRRDILKGLVGAINWKTIFGGDDGKG